MPMTFPVLKADRSSALRLPQSKNILSMYWTFEVSNPDRSSDSRARQPSNMEVMFKAFSVQTPVRSICFSFSQPANIRKKLVRPDRSTQPLKRMDSALM